MAMNLPTPRNPLPVPQAIKNFLPFWTQEPGYPQSNASIPRPTSLRSILILFSHAHLGFHFIYAIFFISEAKFHVHKEIT